MSFMNRCSHFFLVCALLLTCLAGVSAQTVSPAPEQSSNASVPESEERRKKLEEWGLREDPGQDPDPTKVFTRFGKPFYIHKYDIEKSKSEFDQPEGWVRPFGWVNIPRQIYRRDEKFVWVWELVQNAETPLVNPMPEAQPTLALNPEQIKHLQRLIKDFEEAPFRTTSDALVFEEVSTGLPVDGSWRNSMDVADMNGDGKVDIIAPPQRTLDPNPAIFLGDGKGGWKRWETVRFSLPLNYGSVAAGDFNGDGKMDLVFGVHLCCVVPFLGDGKGKFVDAGKTLEDDYFPSRRVLVRDFDRDGDADIIATTEGPTMADRAGRGPDKIRVYLNENKGKTWKISSVAGADRYVGGDWMTVGDFNGDRRFDVAASSIYFGGMDLFYIGEPKGAWKPFGRDWLPIFSSYNAVTSGKFTSKVRDDVIVSFYREWSQAIDPNDFPPPDKRKIVGLDRISWDKDGEAARTPIARWGSDKGVWGLANGDFNRDGHMDIVLLQADPRRLVFLLGDGKGSFRKPELAGIELPPNPAYDVKVADVNGDRWPDVVMMFEAQEKVGTKDGSIRVYLNRSGNKAGSKAAQASTAR